MRARPVSSGTHRILADGNTAVAADSDRDQVYVGRRGAAKLRSIVALAAGDEPGRVVEDGAKRDAGFSRQSSTPSRHKSNFPIFPPFVVVLVAHDRPNGDVHKKAPRLCHARSSRAETRNAEYFSMFRAEFAFQASLAQSGC